MDWIAKLISLTSLTLIIIGLLIIFVIYCVVQQYTRPSGYPPGPPGLPLLGCFLYLTHDWYKDLDKLGEGYGDVYSVYILNKLVIVLNRFASVKDALIDKPSAWGGRPFSYGFQQMGNHPGNLFKDKSTPEWRARKKFALTALKAFGHSFGSQESMISEEAEYTESLFRKTEGKPFMLKHYICISGANPASRILFNKRYTMEENEEFYDLAAATSDWFEAMGAVCEADVVPVLRYVPGRRDLVEKGKRGTKYMVKTFQPIINEHRQNFERGVPRDFIDMCLESDLDDEEIQLYLFSLWGDAIDTAPGAIRWWILYLMLHPECQKKAQGEIDDVLGDRRPALKDKQQLKYLEATVMEAIRITTPVPISLPLMTLEDTTVLGYRIPKNTTYLANWTAVHNDTKVWDSPDEFKPERFIKEDGSLDAKNPAWMGYGVGKRKCMGEPLARQIVFLICVRLLQSFTFSFPDGKEIPDPKSLAISGVTLMAEDFEVVATPRLN